MTYANMPLPGITPVFMRWDHQTNLAFAILFEVEEEKEYVRTFEQNLGHCSGNLDYMLSVWREATLEEYTPLKEQMERFGYKLEICSPATNEEELLIVAALNEELVDWELITNGYEDA